MRLRRIAAFALLLLGAAPAPAGAASASRVVSLNPSLTAILLALDAGSLLVGIDEYSARQQPTLDTLPRVGGLFNASLESVVALEPDLVVMVPSAQQRDLRRRLEDLGIEVLALPNIGLEDLLASIEQLGARVGRADQARRRVAEIRAEWERVARANHREHAPRAVLVLQREPLFVVGSGSFLDAMLRAAGAENAASGFADPYPRVALEWLIAAAPDVILDATEGAPDPLSYWAQWPSLPAVASGRVVALPADQVTLPGPRPERALHLLVEALEARARASSEREVRQGKEAGESRPTRSEAEPSGGPEARAGASSEREVRQDREAGESRPTRSEVSPQ